VATGARVTGLRETVRDLERMGVSVEDLKGAFGRISDNVIRQAQARVPRGETGALAGSIRPAKSKNKAVVRAGGARVRHAGPIHWGWPARNIEARPFLAGPADTYAPDAIKEITAELGTLIRRYGLNT
jgi:hypothetical protein